MKNVLIIKSGLSETLQGTINKSVCFGDILRTTVILNFLKGAHIIWLTEKKAVPLLLGNKHIVKVLINNYTNRQKLLKKQFDIIINLDKILRICKLADSIYAKERFGFGFSTSINTVKAYKNAKDVLAISKDITIKRKNRLTYQEHLANIINKKWAGEKYILGYRPKNKEKFDIGFNWKVAKRWDNKAWPAKCWKYLEKNIEGRYSITWQQGLSDIYQYIDWINSCRLLVTNDSLGMHIALAIGKRLVVLCGPTSPNEIYLYNLGSFVLPRSKYKCLPCFDTICKNDKFCLEDIYPEQVIKIIDYELR